MAAAVTAMAAAAGARAALALATALPAVAQAAREVNFQTPVSPIAEQMKDLHVFIMWFCVVIFVAVFGVMFYSIFKHRKSVGHRAAQFHENTTVEVIWTVIPFLILLFMAFPATRTVLAMKDTSAPDMTVKVTGYQWKWSYDYLQEGFGFYSSLSTPLAQIENREPKGADYLLEVDNPLVVPVDTKVRVLITAADVIHAWWVPALGVKQDAIPGFVRDSWFRADKVGHLPWPVRRALRQGARLHADRRRGEDQGRLRQVGRRAEEEVGGRRRRPGPRVGPPGAGRARRKGLPGELRRLPPGERQGRAERVPGPRRVKARRRPEGRPARAASSNGRPGTAMASFKQLSDTDLAAVITYTRNSWSNKAGEVQPAEVKSARN